MKPEVLFSRYASIISDFKSFMEFINRPLVPSFRINTLKARREEILNLLRDFKLEPVRFYQDAFYLSEKASLGNHYTHGLGLIYGQEIASMVPVYVLDPRPGEIVLDLCAAPGSKTTQIAQFMQNRGLVVANEINSKRLVGLIHNIKKNGLINETVISLPGQRIGGIFPDYFDRVLIDAPCSAEGTIRKSRAVLFHWGIKNIARMARIQKGLILSGFRALKPGGTLVYSTCTIAPEENEGVIDYLLKKCPAAEIMPISIPHFKMHPGITKWQHQGYDERVQGCARILPQDNDTAPFFIAKITKRGVARQRFGFHGKIEFKNEVVEMLTRRFGLPAERFNGYAIFQRGQTIYISTPEVYSFLEIKSIRKGLEIGKTYGSEIKPANDFVQLFGRGVSKNCLEVKIWELQKILKGEKLTIKMPEGFVIITYHQLPIGVCRSNGSELKSEILRSRRLRQ